jgi:hypothetical protein
MELLNKNISLSTFILIDEINNDLIIENLLKDIYNNTKYYPTFTNVVARHTEFNFLNNNKNFIDFMKLIKNQIFSVYKNKFIIDSAWANIYNKDNFANLHDHKSSSAFSGILYLTDGPGPGTYFKDYDLTIHEKKGRFCLFHGHLEHEVKKFNYEKDRITIAFNCVQVGFSDEGQKIVLIK